MKIINGIKYNTFAETNPSSEDKTVLCEPCELSRPLRYVGKTITPYDLYPFDQVSVDIVMIRPSGRILAD